MVSRPALPEQWRPAPTDSHGRRYGLVVIVSMAATLLTAGAVFLVARLDWVRTTMTEHPEALGLVVAALLLLGRYTGYRLTELARFRGLA